MRTRTIAGDVAERSVSMAEAWLQDGQRLLAFNDLFVGARSHVSARYRIAQGGREEEQSSSGVIFSDGIEADRLVFNAGATATIAPAAHKATLLFSG